MKVVRNTLVMLVSKFCTTPEQFKAYSQNLGHENVLTTFTSYGYAFHLGKAKLCEGLGLGKMRVVSETSLMLKEVMKGIEELRSKG